MGHVCIMQKTAETESFILIQYLHIDVIRNKPKCRKHAHMSDKYVRFVIILSHVCEQTRTIHSAGSPRRMFSGSGVAEEPARFQKLKDKL